jgi:hypothetical protein
LAGTRFVGRGDAVVEAVGASAGAAGRAALAVVAFDAGVVAERAAATRRRVGRGSAEPFTTTVTPAMERPCRIFFP